MLSHWKSKCINAPVLKFVQNKIVLNLGSTPKLQLYYIFIKPNILYSMHHSIYWATSRNCSHFEFGSRLRKKKSSNSCFASKIRVLFCPPFCLITCINKKITCMMTPQANWFLFLDCSISHSKWTLYYIYIGKA